MPFIYLFNILTLAKCSQWDIVTFWSCFP